MNHTARELQLHIDNDYQLTRSVAEPIYRNLERKRNAGKFDRTLALKAMQHLADAGARSYVKAYDAPDAVWHRTFTVADRNDCAVMLLDSWQSEIDCGNGWLAREVLA